MANLERYYFFDNGVRKFLNRIKDDDLILKLKDIYHLVKFFIPTAFLELKLMDNKLKINIITDSNDSVNIQALKNRLEHLKGPFDYNFIFVKDNPYVVLKKLDDLFDILNENEDEEVLISAYIYVLTIDENLVDLVKSHKLYEILLNYSYKAYISASESLKKAIDGFIERYESQEIPI